MRSGHKQPNASAGLMPSTSMRVQRTPAPQESLGPGRPKGYVANLAACADGTPVTDDFVIGACHRLN